MLAFVLVLNASACVPTQREFGIQLADLKAVDSSNGLNVRASQEVRLSGEARKALRNGVPIRVRVDLAVQESGSWSDICRDFMIYEIRYLPLSDHYQLTGPTANAIPLTYPRLRHVLAQLRSIEWRIEDLENEPGQYELRMRSHLDRTGMPGPMQLPMLFSSDWVHDSGWVSYDFQVGS